MGCPSGSLEGKFKGTNYGDNHHEFWSKVWQQDPSDIYDGKYLVTIIEPTPSNSNWTWTYGMYVHCVAKVYAVLPVYTVKCLYSGGRK